MNHQPQKVYHYGIPLRLSLPEKALKNKQQRIHKHTQWYNTINTYTKNSQYPNIVLYSHTQTHQPTNKPGIPVACT